MTWSCDKTKVIMNLFFVVCLIEHVCVTFGGSRKSEPASAAGADHFCPVITSGCWQRWLILTLLAAEFQQISNIFSQFIINVLSLGIQSSDKSEKAKCRLILACQLCLFLDVTVKVGLQHINGPFCDRHNHYTLLITLSLLYHTFHDGTVIPAPQTKFQLAALAWMYLLICVFTCKYSFTLLLMSLDTWIAHWLMGLSRCLSVSFL